MEYILLFSINWIILLYFVDIKKIKYNIFAGIMTVIMVIAVDYPNIVYKNLYYLNNPVIKIWGSSAFFIFGPPFTVAILIAQLNPRKWYLRVFHVLIIATLYSLVELILLKKGALVYVNWTFFDSIRVNYPAIVLISWFDLVVLRHFKNKEASK